MTKTYQKNKRPKNQETKKPKTNDLNIPKNHVRWPKMTWNLPKWLKMPKKDTNDLN